MATTLLAGTYKGAFLLRDGAGGWEIEGPHFPGEEVAAIAHDPRTGRILAATGSNHWGAVVRTSDDGGRSWSDPAAPPLAFPEDTGAALERIWHFRPAGEDEPGVVWAGVAPAALFRSEDGGDTFSLARGLWDHPHRSSWMPGFGGMALHTILLHPVDPAAMLVAISAAGVYRSEDGGASWNACNDGIRSAGMPDPYPEFGQCVHKVSRDAGDPARLYAQNHGGVYRSDDDGAAWTEISAGLPASFGFPVVAHPTEADTAFVIPLVSDEQRFTPDGQLRVFRTRDAGSTWESTSTGLPHDDAYSTVLRDAFTSGDDGSLAFGTRGGQIYFSPDAGNSWRAIAGHLPPVLCVRVAEV